MRKGKVEGHSKPCFWRLHDATLALLSEPGCPLLLQYHSPNVMSRSSGDRRSAAMYTLVAVTKSPGDTGRSRRCNAGSHSKR